MPSADGAHSKVAANNAASMLTPIPVERLTSDNYLTGWSYAEAFLSCPALRRLVGYCLHDACVDLPPDQRCSTCRDLAPQPREA